MSRLPRRDYNLTSLRRGIPFPLQRAVPGCGELAQNQPVDLILLDINLPDENGLMLTRALRERSTVGIILVTGRSDRIDRIVGLEMGGQTITSPNRWNCANW